MIILENKNIQIHFVEETGSIAMIKGLLHNNALVSNESSQLPLFKVRWRKDKSKNKVEITPKEASSIMISREGNDILKLRYDFEGLPVGEVLATISLDHRNLASVHFSFETKIVADDGYVEWIEYPGVYVPNNLIKNGGNARILWPALEGILVEDIDIREKSWMSYQPMEYPNRGWAGYYPGCAPMQFLAYYTQSGEGLYFSSEDSEFYTKEIEYNKVSDESIQLIIKTYPGAVKAGTYVLPFNLRIELFEGDWMDAAELYRAWSENHLKLPPRILDNAKIPQWLHHSPIVATYPITGEGHHSGPTQPNEFFPYENVLPHLDSLSELLDSSFLTLLMQWEGTAPWAPPYVWPPLGGVEMMKTFADKLHERGHFFGLYCSGLAWTTTADTGPGDYNRIDEERENDRIKEMCQGPDGEYECLICNGEGIRRGYDMCVCSDFAQKVTTQEALSIASVGADYIQLLDQNLGGAAYQCHDDRHGHPSAPGKWQAEAMNGLLLTIQKAFGKANYSVVLGCESASAESYIEQLPVNDLRFQIGYNMGKPVPLYNYVYHQYVVNFMGNQVEAMVFVNKEKSPENHYLRYAYSFVAGDLLTIVLADKGQIHWSWCTKWSVDKPDQKLLTSFICHLNTWRKAYAKDYLLSGKMLKPWNVVSAVYTLHLANEKSIEYPSVLTSRWQSVEGDEAQLIVNYLPQDQEIYIREPINFCIKTLCGNMSFLEPEKPIIIPALSAVLITPHGLFI